MVEVEQAVYDRLINDDYLSARLATFNSRPAVFTQVPLPDGFEHGTFPYVISEANVADDTNAETGGDTKTSIGRVVDRDIRVYQSADDDSAEIEKIADHIFELFHEKELYITGWKTIRTRASGPLVAPTTQEDVRGRVVSITIALIEEEN